MSGGSSRHSRPEAASSREEVIGLLAPALGEAKARQIVTATARSLGLEGDEWPIASLRALLTQVGAEPGLVGITARVVLRRLTMPGHGPSESHGGGVAAGPEERPPGEAPRAAGEAPRAPGEAPRGPGEAPRGFAETVRKPWESVSDLLVPALGDDGARAAVERALQTLGLGRTLTSGEAQRVLEEIAKEPGVIGIAARFAKTRLHLLSW